MFISLIQVRSSLQCVYEKAEYDISTLHYLCIITYVPEITIAYVHSFLEILKKKRKRRKAKAWKML